MDKIRNSRINPIRNNRSGNLFEPTAGNVGNAQQNQLKTEIDNLNAALEKNPDDLNAWINPGNGYKQEKPM